MRAPWAWCWCCYSRRRWWSIATATTAAGAAGCEIQSTNPSGARHHPSIPAALLPPLLSSSVRPPRRLLPGVPRPARRRLSSVEVVVVVDAVGVSNESKVSRAWESTDQPADVSTPVRGRRRPGSTPRAMVDNAVRSHGPSAPPTAAPASKQPAMHAYKARARCQEQQRRGNPIFPHAPARPPPCPLVRRATSCRLPTPASTPSIPPWLPPPPRATLRRPVHGGRLAASERASRRREGGHAACCLLRQAGAVSAAGSRGDSRGHGEDGGGACVCGWGWVRMAESG